MEALIIIGTGLVISAIRIGISKKSGKSKNKKLVYYNYSRFAVKYKKIDDSLNQQSKSF